MIKLKKEVQNNIRQKFDKYDDNSIRFVMYSLYLNEIIQGPYASKATEDMIKDHTTRKLFKQLFFGAYGPAGIVYSIQGSPARGIILATEDSVFFDNYRIKPVSLIYDGSLSFNMDLMNYFMKSYKTESEKFMKQINSNPEMEAFIRKNKDDPIL